MNYHLLILLVLGLFYAFAPHNLHVALSPDWNLLGINLSHGAHKIIGYILLVLVGVMYHYQAKV